MMPILLAVHDFTKVPNN